jgi:hypothetical protein
VTVRPPDIRQNCTTFAPCRRPYWDWWQGHWRSALQPVGHPTLLVCADGGVCNDTIWRRSLLGVAERGGAETHQHEHVEPRAIAWNFCLWIVLRTYVVGFERSCAGVTSSLDKLIAELGKLQSLQIHRFVCTCGGRPQIAGCSDTSCKHHTTRNGPTRHRSSPGCQYSTTHGPFRTGS